MIMPHSTIQRDFWEARRARLRIDRREQNNGTDAPAGRGVDGIRVQVGHWLIGAGSRLSGERVETIRHSAPQRAG